MEYFLEKIASHLLAEHGNKLSEHCMVFPNRRAGLYFLKYLSSLAGKPVWSPAVKTINELFLTDSNLKIADNEILIFELFRIYNTINPGKEKFDDFYFWGDLLINDFDDVDKYLADPLRLFDNLADIKRIEERFGGLTDEQVKVVKQFWMNFNEGPRTSEKNDFLQIWSILPALYSGFRKSLSQKGIAYEGMIFRELAEKCMQGDMPDFKWNTIHFTGFNALNECEKVLMHTLRDAGKARFYWDFDNSYADKTSNHSAGYFIRSNLAEFGNNMPPDWSFSSGLSPGSDLMNSRIIETASDIAQVKLLPELLEKMEDINGPNAHHTAIILSDESMLIPLLSTIPSYVRDVNVTMGYPLKFSPVYSLVSHLLSLQRNSRKEGSEILFDHRDVLNILRHNYFAIIFKESPDDIISTLISENRQWIPASWFREKDALKMVFSSPETPAQLASYIKSVLETIFVSGKESEDAFKEMNTAEKMRNEFIYRTLLALNRLGDVISEAGVTLSPITWTRLLEKIIRAISIPFSGEPLNGVQVMGILETRSLDFRNIILLSSNEGSLPGSASSSSYIPYNLREAFGLPGIKHQDSIYAYYFYRLLHRAENVTFIYNSNSEGIKTGEMSRFLLQMIHLEKKKPEMLGLGFEIFTPPLIATFIERNEIHTEKLNDLFLKPGSKPVSPSAVNTWLTCRMKFFYRYICNIKEPDKILTEIDPAMFGAILHGIMHRIYQPFIGRTVDAAGLKSVYGRNESLSAIINEVMTASFYGGNEQMIDGNSMIICNILESYARMILKYDQSLGPIKISGLEMGIYAPLEVLINGNLHKVTCGGFIDRLDILEGISRVIDYKTGNVDMSIRSVTSLFDEEDESRSEAWFQVLMYCEIFTKAREGEHIRPGIYALRNIAGKDFSDRLEIGTSKDNRSRIDDYSEIRNEFSPGLGKVLEMLFDKSSHFTMTSNTRKCEYCPYRQLCFR